MQPRHGSCSVSRRSKELGACSSIKLKSRMLNIAAPRKHAWYVAVAHGSSGLCYMGPATRCQHTRSCADETHVVAARQPNRLPWHNPSPSAGASLGLVAWQHALSPVVDELKRMGVAYYLHGYAAALVQGVALQDSRLLFNQHSPRPPQITSGPNDALHSCADDPLRLEVRVQWDQMQDVHAAFTRLLWRTSPLHSIPGGSYFTLSAASIVESALLSSGASSDACAGLRSPDAGGMVKRGQRAGVAGSGGSSSSSSGTPAGEPWGLQGAQVQVSCNYNEIVASRPHRVEVRVQLRAPTDAATGSSGSSNNSSGGGDTGIGKRSPVRSTDSSASSGKNGTCPGSHAASEIVWAMTLHAVRQHAEVSGPRGTYLADQVSSRLSELQSELTAINSSAWADGDTYAAWVQRLGTPPEAAAKLSKDPGRRMGPLLDHLLGGGNHNFDGTRVANLMGSHGSKAVAMALMGAQATVVDVSPGNARYALELAAAAGVHVDYIVHDVLQLQRHPRFPQLRSSFHQVLLEQGILHYFVDLQPLFALIHELLTPGGKLVLRDFHPVSTKLICNKPGSSKLKVSGNYFDPRPSPSAASFSKFGDAPNQTGGHPAEELARSRARSAAQSTGSSSSSSSSSSSRRSGGGGSSSSSGGAPVGAERATHPQVLLRKWTLGEVVTAVARSGLQVTCLEEEPGPKESDWGLPKVFTLVAKRSTD